MKYLFHCILTIYTSGIWSQTEVSNYKDSILNLRILHAAELIDSTSGILNNDEIKSFQGVSYFEVDTNFLVIGTFVKFKGKKFQMPTSTARLPWYRRYGYVYFECNGIKDTLTVYQNLELKMDKDFRDYLFIPFRDATCKTKSYGGGRYLDTSIPKSNQMVLDFNLAYNPYCAYSIRYSCPIPPEENTLPFEIFAGEKVPVGYERH
jgi:uncharacterized protein (DUF1684 family)